MKKSVILSLVIVSLMISLVSAEIIINEQPKSVYNLGDTISIPVKVTSLTNTYGILQMNLLCDGKNINFYKNGISLVSGDEKDIEALIPLTKDIIEDARGACKIKASLLKEYILTQEFTISDVIKVKASTNKNRFDPEEEILITGNATKESETELNGIVEITFAKGSSTKIKQTEIITDGKFSSKIKTPKNMEAGEYVVTISAYEKDAQERITNNGFENYIIEISSIPTSLEIFFQQKEINPGETLKVKAILHDQTGEKIDSVVVISIKDENDKILEQVEEKTDSFIDYEIKAQQAPSEWKIVALSHQIISESAFNINEVEKISIEIINKTVILTNIGNVLYNKTVFVKIGEEPLNIDTTLNVGESKKYSLTAPEGEYSVRVLSPEGEEVQTSVALTGDVISVTEYSGEGVALGRHPFTWVFITIVLGIVAFSLFKREHKRSFWGYFHSNTPKGIRQEERIYPHRSVLVSPKNKASLSLSIKGENQKSSVVCLKIKNYAEIGSTKGGARDVLQKITDMAERVNAYVYENNDSLFFLLAPLMTKNTENEMVAADLAQSAKKAIDDYNKLFKQRISYGISADYGDIIIRKDGDAVGFAGLNNFILNAKKLASVSNGEVVIGENMKGKIQSNTKLEKCTFDRGSYYVLKEIRDKEKSKTFMSAFVKRYERDNKINRTPSKTGETSSKLGQSEEKREEPKEEKYDDFEL